MNEDIQITALAPAADSSDEARRVLGALSESPRRLPTDLHYDRRGSALFEEITRQPEYYLTRAERGLLQAVAPAVARRSAAATLIELGSGSAEKTRLLLDAFEAEDGLRIYAPFDVDRTMVARVAEELTAEYAGLRIHGVVGDLRRDLGKLPSFPAPRLLALLGSTIGNLRPDEAAAFLAQVQRVLRGEDRFLLGVDLIKDSVRLTAAYNDAAGVTAQFSRNILHVVNRRFGFDFRPELFEHRSVWRDHEHRIETSLVAVQAHRVESEALGFGLDLAAGESIRTEISTKYDRSIVEAMLTATGLTVTDWYQDDAGDFALVLAAPGKPPHPAR